MASIYWLPYICGIRYIPRPYQTTPLLLQTVSLNLSCVCAVKLSTRRTSLSNLAVGGLRVFSTQCITHLYWSRHFLEKLCQHSCAMKIIHFHSYACLFHKKQYQAVAAFCQERSRSEWNTVFYQVLLRNEKSRPFHGTGSGWISDKCDWNQRWMSKVADPYQISSLAQCNPI